MTFNNSFSYEYLEKESWQPPRRPVITQRVRIFQKATCRSVVLDNVKRGMGMELDENHRIHSKTVLRYIHFAFATNKIVSNSEFFPRENIMNVFSVFK